jgi:hypothetical protein
MLDLALVVLIMHPMGTPPAGEYLKNPSAGPPLVDGFCFF